MIMITKPKLISWKSHIPYYQTLRTSYRILIHVSNIWKTCAVMHQMFVVDFVNVGENVWTQCRQRKLLTTPALLDIFRYLNISSRVKASPLKKNMTTDYISDVLIAYAMGYMDKKPGLRLSVYDDYFSAFICTKSHPFNSVHLTFNRYTTNLEPGYFLSFSAVSNKGKIDFAEICILMYTHNWLILF